MSVAIYYPPRSCGFVARLANVGSVRTTLMLCMEQITERCRCPVTRRRRRRQQQQQRQRRRSSLNLLTPLFFSTKQDLILAAATDFTSVDVTRNVGFSQSFWLKYAPAPVQQQQQLQLRHPKTTTMTMTLWWTKKRKFRILIISWTALSLFSPPINKQQSAAAAAAAMAGNHGMSTGSAMSLNTSSASRSGDGTTSTMLSPPTFCSSPFSLTSPTSQMGWMNKTWMQARHPLHAHHFCCPTWLCTDYRLHRILCVFAKTLSFCMCALFCAAVCECSFVSVAVLFCPFQFVVLLLLVCGLTHSLTVIRWHVAECTNNAVAECSGSHQHGHHKEDKSPNISLSLLFLLITTLPSLLAADSFQRW